MKYILTILLIAPLIAISQSGMLSIVSKTVPGYSGFSFRVAEPQKMQIRGWADTIPTGVFVDEKGYLRYIKEKPDTIRVVKVDTVTVIRNYRDTLYVTQIVYKDTCSVNPVDPGQSDPPPTSGTDFKFQITQKSFASVAVPGGKLESWSEQWLVNQSYNKQDGYFRFSWSMLEGAQGQYTFDVFKRQAEMVFARGGRFGFGIMTHYPDAVSPHRLNYDGGYSVYPQYLHNLMQGESVKDWRASNGAWVPNWNSSAYHDRLLALHKALDAYIKQQGWQDRISYVDIRGYGAFGEWHSYTIAGQMSQYPAGTRATESSLRKIVDAHTQGFPDFPLVALVSAYDANRLGNTMNPPGIAHYLLTQKNRWGLIGWRRDNWGIPDDYPNQYTVRNTYVVNGIRLDTAIMNRWKYAPVVGEPCCGHQNNYSGLVSQLTTARATNVGNGNISSLNNTVRKAVTDAGEAIGSRLTITTGNFKDGAVTIEWDNKGNVPLYEAFNVVAELRQGGTVVWSASAPLVQVQPGKSTQVFQGGTVPRGTFELHIFVRNNYRSYPLGITSSKVADVKN